MDAIRNFFSGSKTAPSSISNPPTNCQIIAKRVFDSPFFWTTTRLSAIAMTTAYVIASGGTPLPFITSGLMMGLINFSPAVADQRKLLFEASFVWTFFSHHILRRPWYHTIIQDHLTLGAIPLVNYNHIQEIKNKKINAVLTLLESHEWNQSNLYGCPAKKVDWEQSGIEHLIIDTPDFTPLSQENIQKGIEFLKKIIQDNKGHVYVHCKAGAGRSSTIVICYLIKYGSEHGLKKFLNVAEAIAYAEKLRSAVNINPRQREAITTFYNSLPKES